MTREKLDRVCTALRGDAPDRPPYSFWTHLPHLDLDPVRLADATAAFCTRYDLDFVKTMPNGMYPVEDWGCVCDYTDIERGGVARVVRPAVVAPEDWNRLESLDVTTGSFGRELDHFSLVVKLVGSVPVLATVFSPLTIAAKLSNSTYRDDVARHPELLTRALEVITDTTCAFAREAVARGCAGIFLATQEASYGLLGEAAYRSFGEPYDRRVLRAATAAGGWFNVIHMHGENVMFDLLSQYEVAALNWHIGETAPSINDYRASGGTTPIVGGLSRDHLTHRNRVAIGRDVDRAMSHTGGKGLLLAPPCVIRHPVDDAMLCFVARTIKSLASTPGSVQRHPNVLQRPA
jgi:uroporphyrinogen decarboxylase